MLANYEEFRQIIIHHSSSNGEILLPNANTTLRVAVCEFVTGKKYTKKEASFVETIRQLAIYTGLLKHRNELKAIIHREVYEQILNYNARQLNLVKLKDYQKHIHSDDLGSGKTFSDINGPIPEYKESYNALEPSKQKNSLYWLDRMIAEGKAVEVDNSIFIAPNNTPATTKAIEEACKNTNKSFVSVNEGDASKVNQYKAKWFADRMSAVGRASMFGQDKQFTAKDLLDEANSVRVRKSIEDGVNHILGETKQRKPYESDGRQPAYFGSTNYSLEEILIYFDNGFERFNTEPFFNHVIRTLLDTGKYFNVLDICLTQIERNNATIENLLKNQLLNFVPKIEVERPEFPKDRK